MTGIIYTLGYQGISLEQYKELLLQHQIGLVLDVREVAWSYKKGFSKGTLEKSLNESGISYLHVKSAGNPSPNRKKPTKESMEGYRQLLKEDPRKLTELSDRVRDTLNIGGKVCLTCFEKDHNDCHRSIIAEALLTWSVDLQVIHLQTI